MVHDRDAHGDVLAVLEQEGPPRVVVFHCFSGDAAMARTCVDAGYVLSFSGTVTFRNARTLREAAVLVPEEQLLVETDAPFLTPHPHRGKANEPVNLPYTVWDLAALRGQDVAELAASSSAVAERVFGFARRAHGSVPPIPLAGR
jgi:TatD DNase family protein